MTPRRKKPRSSGARGRKAKATPERAAGAGPLPPCGCDPNLEISIAPDGRVIIKHPTDELLDLAIALDPENEELRRRRRALRGRPS